jgi:Na+-transporting methylmalonyl-CoA/oxaloacetate decarboxylase gamma subunit
MNKMGIIFTILILLFQVISPVGALASEHPFTAEAKKLSKLTIDKKELELEKGESANIHVTATYSDGSNEDVTKKVSWTSSKSSVATVSKGKVTAKSEGRATIKASYSSGGMKKTATLTVLVVKSADSGKKGTWTKAGNMSEERVLPWVVPLSDGKAFVTGGGSVSGEIFDAKKNTWKKLKTSFGFEGEPIFVSVVQMYGPEAGTDEVLVFHQEGNKYIAQVFLPDKDKFADPFFSEIEIEERSYPIGHVILPNGNIVIFFRNFNNVFSAVYDYKENSFTTNDPVDIDHDVEFASFIALSNEEILAAGGHANGEYAYRDVSIYNLNKNEWKKGTEMNVSRGSAPIVKLPNGNLFIIGGAASEDFLTAELYDAKKQKWTVVGKATMVPSVVVLLQDGRVLLTGGWKKGEYYTTLDDAMIFDPKNNKFVQTGKLKEKRASAGSAVLTDGRVLVAGGRGNGFDSTLSSAEIFTP